jgi:uncharacterized Zn finger protein (UPF0148 family)
MSGISVFQKISQKLDEGWKLTNVSCPICKTCIVGYPKTKEFYCVKCDMPAKIGGEDDDYEVEVEVIGNEPKKITEIEEFDNMVISRNNDPKRKRADELSKKMGDLLLQGWTMLEDTCYDCLFPYMRSRKGEVICVGCGPVEKKKENPPAVEKIYKLDPIHSSPEIIEKKSETWEEESKESYKEVREVPKEPTKLEKYSKEKEFTPEKRKKEEKESPKKEEKFDKKSIQVEDLTLETKDIDQVFEAGKFDESIALYTKITHLLNEDLDKLAEKGTIFNLDKIEKIIEVQKKIDKAKRKLFHKLKK